MRNWNIFDIETGPRPGLNIRDFYHDDAPEEVWQERESKAALSALTGQVLAIGWGAESFPDGIGVWGNLTGDTKGEMNLLNGFWNRCEWLHRGHPWDKWKALPNEPKIIGFASNTFDIPFLVQRSWALGVPVPAFVRPDRYLHRMFVDLRDVWEVGARRSEGLPRNSMDNVCQVLGLPRKNGSGADFGRLWMGTAEERAQAIAYLENDIRMTAALAERLLGREEKINGTKKN